MSLPFPLLACRKQVATHRGKEACYICLDNMIFDVTAFLKKHPGGELLLLRMSGAQNRAQVWHPSHQQPHYSVGAAGTRALGRPCALRLSGQCVGRSGPKSTGPRLQRYFQTCGLLTSLSPARKSPPNSLNPQL